MAVTWGAMVQTVDSVEPHERRSHRSRFHTSSGQPRFRDRRLRTRHY